MIDIAAARRELGLTQKQLAAVLGVEVGSISTWERGTHINPLAEFAIAALLSGYRPPNWPESDVEAT
jgi:DNA-binding transcriptional regulator YiaG